MLELFYTIKINISRCVTNILIVRYFSNKLDKNNYRYIIK
jgi:hypothetical protein